MEIWENKNHNISNKILLDGLNSQKNNRKQKKKKKDWS